MDGYHQHAEGGKFVTYDRLSAMGTNGFQEPAVDFKDGKIIGTKRLYADGKFGKSGKAQFIATQWRGLEASGKQQEKEKFAYLINNGRANHVCQTIYLDQYNDFVMDRWPLPLPRIESGGHEGAGGSIPAISSRFTTTTARPRRWRSRGRPQGASKPSCCSRIPTGTMGNVVSKGVNELIIPNYKQTWANIRKIADAPEVTRRRTFKSQEYVSS